MASDSLDIHFINEADISFVSSVSLPSLRQGLADNFLGDDSSDSGEELTWSDFSDLSSEEETSVDEEEELSSDDFIPPEQSAVTRKVSSRRKKVVNKEKECDAPSKKKKKTGTYLSSEDVKKLEETLKCCELNVQSLCEDNLKNDKSLSLFPLRKKMVSTLLESEPVKEMFGVLCQEMFSRIIMAFTQVSKRKEIKSSDKRALFSHKCADILLLADSWENWKNITRALISSNEEDTAAEELNRHAAVLLNISYWTLYETFMTTVLQKKKIDSEEPIQPISEAADSAVVDSDFVDVARVSGAALHKLKKGKEKIIRGRKGAKKVSEATKKNYVTEVKLMEEMVCSPDEKKSLPLGLKTLDEGNLTFFSRKFSYVLSVLDKRIREMINEKNQKRYPKHLMKLTKQTVSLDEELCDLFLRAADAVCKAPVEEVRVRSIWQGLVKKICHTRFKEFYSAQEERKLLQEGKVVSADQSLRDKLKTYSVDKRS